ncbi:MAG: cell surface protein SprA [Bacteroidales bacterium]
MRNKRGSKKIYIIIFLFCFYLIEAGYTSNPYIELKNFQSFVQSNIEEQDSVGLRYKIAETTVKCANDLNNIYPIDLMIPENIKGVFEFNSLTDTYIYRNKIDDIEIGAPFYLTRKEYMQYRMETMRRAYYREKLSIYNDESSVSQKFNPFDMAFSLRSAEKIFGPGNIQIQTQGFAELSIGIQRNVINNPQLSEHARKLTSLKFNPEIQLNMNAKVGDKVDFNMNYNTNVTFDFDKQKLKLTYEGAEDEIIKHIEAGNVNFSSSGGLIRGTQSLFGIKTGLQFGKLRLTGIVAQQESESDIINTQGGVQTTSFEVSIENYDENRHYFLAHYFRDTYDKSMNKLPYISSGYIINKVEVWITNKRGNFDQARNIVAFMDLGESRMIGNSFWSPMTTNPLPQNNANTLYNKITTTYNAIRNINLVNPTLDPLETDNIYGGQDYDKIESARKLDPSEYILNKQLGYISLKSTLQSDEILAVAFEYTYEGKTYQVGEFSSDITNSTQSLYLKLLRSTGLTPNLPMWGLMMKNVYSLNALQIDKDRFRLDIQYRSDTTGVYINYLPEGDIKNETLLHIMNLDRLDARQETRPDGFFDFVEGFTIHSQTGRLIFPVLEPFGSHLRKKIGNEAIADKFIFQELYDSTKVEAAQFAEKNKYRMKGEYRATNAAEIRLNAMNIPRGSVKVMAGGQELKENIDYSVDYMMGVVTIINQSLIDSGIPVNVTLENQSIFSMQRKTLLGLDAVYAFNKNFHLGATIMHLREKSLVQKVAIGDESISNTIWGLNMQYRKESQWLTDLLNKIPFVNAALPSQMILTAEFAQLVPGHPKELSKQGIAYVDDFESTKTAIDLKNPYAWILASTPTELINPLYADRLSENGVNYYGKNRSLINWFYVDGMFTRKNSSLTPSHIKNDKDQLSDHWVREVMEQELYPNKETEYNEISAIQILNLAYYPKERGPYNVDALYMGSDGYLEFPEQRWGGIMRKLDNTDFEVSNIEYIQFWMLDPFIKDKDRTSNGGELIFNLGDVSEDILKDGRKMYENGLPINGDLSLIEDTYWGRVPKRQSLTYAFDNTPGARSMQDVGLNGINTETEHIYPTYRSYIEGLKTKISPQTRAKWDADKYSPINDPGGDNYHYFRGSDWDRAEKTILERYKRYNGTEGNSPSSFDSPETYDTSYKVVPDVEDANQDNTLNEYERYYQYQVAVKRESMKVGYNFIVDKRTTRVKLRNGKEEDVSWYQFKIPIRDYQKKVGNIRDFKAIRFVRLFLTGFRDSTVLRFGSLELVQSDWRQYQKPLHAPDVIPGSVPTLDISAVNIEENASREPVNYVLPPGVSRIVDPVQPQLFELNEQSLVLKVQNLSPTDACAAYKNMNLDMRQYKRLQMFVHAEKLIDDLTDLKSGELSVFLRIGSDYKHNYYEYEIPLCLTPPGYYNNNSTADREIVWPEQNMFDFPLELLTNLKLERNREKRHNGSSVTFATPYTAVDPNKPANRITVIGNPSLSDLKSIMIGVRNNASTIKAGEIWVNELRLAQFNEESGWAFQGNLNISLSDVANVNFSGRKETVGFGSVEQSVMDRRMDDFYQYNIAANVDAGRFLPERIKIKAPVYYAYSEQVTTPKYNPLDQDIEISDAMREALNQAERDSIKHFAQDVVHNKSFSVTNFKVDIASKRPMPYDPANFTLSYGFNGLEKHSPSVAFERSADYRGYMSYTYTPMYKGWEPFKKMNGKSWKIAKDIQLNYMPQNITFTTSVMRYYFESLYRDLSAPGDVNKGLLSFRKDFLWDREFTLRWDLTRHIKFTFRSGTNARIDEPDGRVNRHDLPDEYRLWKDSVMMSIAELGRPMNYGQTANFRFAVPVNKIRALSWTNLDIKYASTYNWERGAVIDDETNLGNIIRNTGSWNGDLRLNFEGLYNKSKFLKRVNQRFSNKYKENKKETSVNNKKLIHLQKISLTKDGNRMVRHNLDSRYLTLFANDRDGRTVNVRFIIEDANTIQVFSDTDQELQLTIHATDSSPYSKWKEVAQYASRALMSVRTVSMSYRHSGGLHLPSFNPEVGDLFGQRRNQGFLSPGLDFAFGFTDEGYVDKAISRGWMIVNDSVVTPAMSNFNEDIQIQAQIEPVKGLKIALIAQRIQGRSNQINFMYEGRPVIQSGGISMSFMALSSSLRTSNARGGYQSDFFDRLVAYRDIVAGRLTNQYMNSMYPSQGFMEGNILAGKPYDPSVSPINKNMPDVLIPAFIAAYTRRSPEKTSLSFFPGLLSMIPNWRVSFDGLIQLPFIKKRFKSFNLTHAYKCTYDIANYSTFINYAESEDGFGYVQDQLTKQPLPSSMYDIGAVVINESFSPLIGINVMTKSNISAKAEVKNSRSLALNIGSVQLVEQLSTEYIIGGGYTIPDLRIFYKVKGGKQSSIMNELKFLADVIYRRSEVMIRKIEEGYTQPATGTSIFTFRFSADYTLSRSLNLRGFFDQQVNTPLVSSAAFPVSDSSFGVAVRLILNR